MKKYFMLMTSLLMLAACGPRREVVKAIDLTDLDTTVSPKADFYQYATGGWKAKNPLKPEFSRYGSFDVLAELNQERLNDLFGGCVVLEMTTLDAFFEKLEASGADIPEYTGDFTDWWADGIASTPEAVKLYRDAQRKRNLAAHNTFCDRARGDSDKTFGRSSRRDAFEHLERIGNYIIVVGDPEREHGLFFGDLYFDRGRNFSRHGDLFYIRKFA